LPASGYSRKVVAYLDVLGFRSIILETAQGRDPTEFPNCFLGEAHSDVNHVGCRESERELGTAKYKLLQREVSAGNPRKSAVAYFSDSILISADADEIGIADLVSRIRFLQLAFLWEADLPVRGGIAFGDIVHEKTRMYGPALIEAYDLERAPPGHPRVVVSENAIPLLRENPSVAADLDLTRDTDGRQILDLFGSGLGTIGDRQRREVFGGHRASIEISLRGLKGSEQGSDLRVRSKWRYLIGQLNSTMSRFSIPGMPIPDWLAAEDYPEIVWYA